MSDIIRERIPQESQEMVLDVFRGRTEVHGLVNIKRLNEKFKVMFEIKEYIKEKTMRQIYKYKSKMNMQSDHYR